MKSLLFFSSLIFSQMVFADVITECGEYTARGIVRAEPKGLALIVNEKTRSQYIITMPFNEQVQISSFINKPVAVQLVLDKTLDGQTGTTSKIISAKFRIPDPLNPEDTGFKLDKKIDCKKD